MKNLTSEDADWKNIEACLYSEILLEIWIRKIQQTHDHDQGNGVALNLNQCKFEENNM